MMGFTKKPPEPAEAPEPTQAAIDTVAAQRDFLKGQLAQRLERFHGLRLACGDINAQQLVGIVNQELGNIDQVLQQIAAMEIPNT